MTASSPGPRSASEILGWWEKRRLPYSLIVGSVGILSLLLFYYIMEQPSMLVPGEDAVEPFMLWLAPLAVNLCYTAGFAAELLLRGTSRVRPLGPRLMRLGLSISLAVVWVPTLASAAQYFGLLRKVTP